MIHDTFALVNEQRATKKKMLKFPHEQYPFNMYYQLFESIPEQRKAHEDGEKIVGRRFSISFFLTLFEISKAASSVYYSFLFVMLCIGEYRLYHIKIIHYERLPSHHLHITHVNALNSNNIFVQLKSISPPHCTAYTIHSFWSLSSISIAPFE